jgi:hypothetical protein
MNQPILKCPFCQGFLRNTNIYPGRPLVCGTCRAKLQRSIGQLRLSALVGLCFTVAICYFFGVSREWFLVATILLWFPVYVIWDSIFVRVTPPRFETFDSFISLDLHDPSSTLGPESCDGHNSADRSATDSQSESGSIKRNVK